MHTADIGTRVELVPMDPQCHDITLGLYRVEDGAGPAYLVHTYSSKPGAAARVEFVSGAMASLGAMIRDGLHLRHACGAAHHAATKRLFLEACKLPSGEAPAPRPLSVVDKKSGKTVTVTSGHQVDAEGDTARAEAIAAGLRKLAELNAATAFDCGHPHDELIGLLLPRALNVRAVLREEEAIASRGLLVAPSAQK
ncbi:MAG: hypothetical protein SFV51_21615 [Bryobacteraceae bacterium]|nr:hypothetical protein [Bryobacteraceae bacterium]